MRSWAACSGAHLPGGWVQAIAPAVGGGLAGVVRIVRASNARPRLSRRPIRGCDTANSGFAVPSGAVTV